MDRVNVKINGIDYNVDANATILEACKSAAIDIPALCYMKEINAIGACRVCLVEVKGIRTLAAACVAPVGEGMEIMTNTPAVRSARKMNLELLLSEHTKDCLSCIRNQNCELQKMSKDFAVEDENYFAGYAPEFPIEQSTVFLVRDNNKCIKCRRCVAVCGETQGIAAIGANERGLDTYIGCAFNRDLDEMACVGCGQCIAVCPTAALTEAGDTAKVYEALADEEKYVVVITAPAVRVSLGECFGMPIGTNTEGKMIAALRRLGFKNVFDVPVGADFTVMEESAEIIQRLDSGENLPIMTSCCSSWVSYCEQYYPEFIPNLSTCKPPQIMLGALLKVYYANKIGIDPKNLFVVSIMPCTSKKEEILRPNNQAIPGIKDVDVVITTRELANMIKTAGLMFENLPDEEFDPALGISTAAGYIFGTSGGVAEAAMRTITEKIGDTSDKVDFVELRGMQGVKVAEYDLNGRKVKVAVVSGLKNVGKLLDGIKSGEVYYDVVEVMASPGGCIGGGGQPIQDGLVMNFTDINSLRSSALYQGADDSRPLRKSHESPIIQELYRDIIGEPGGENAHKWLHTKYQARPKYSELVSDNLMKK